MTTDIMEKRWIQIKHWIDDWSHRFYELCSEKYKYSDLFPGNIHPAVGI